jgi:hypothetical protein
VAPNNAPEIPPSILADIRTYTFTIPQVGTDLFKVDGNLNLQIGNGPSLAMADIGENQPLPLDTPRVHFFSIQAYGTADSSN